MKKIDENNIVLNLPQLVGLGLTPNQYVYLAILYSQGDMVAKMLINLADEEYKYLLEQDYITYDNKKRVQILVKGDRLFNPKDDDEDLFSELYKAFPRKVPDGKGGIRVLRAEALDSKDAETCRRKYNNIIKGDKKLHKKILSALKTELRVKKNSLQFMNNLETWLNQRVYEKYTGFDEDEIDDQERTVLL